MAHCEAEAKGVFSWGRDIAREGGCKDGRAGRDIGEATGKEARTGG